MKNTMKKIMGLLLVAVLLVSVVPFQALAAGEFGGAGAQYKGFQNIEVYVDTVLQEGSGPWTEQSGKGPEGKTVRELLDSRFSSWNNGEYNFYKAVYNGNETTSLDTVLYTDVTDTTVKLYLGGKAYNKVTVTYLKDGTSNVLGYGEFSVKEGNSLSFNEIADKAPEKDAYKLDRVTGNGGALSFTSGSTTISGETYLNAYLKGIGSTDNNGGNSGSTGNTGVLTAIYHINNTTNTQYYDVNGKTVRELVSMGGYNVSDYNVTPSNLDTIYNRGQSVDIYLSPKTTTPTNPTTPSSNRLNANFYVNSTSTISKSFPFNFDTKYVDQLISEAGYNIDNYNYSAKVDGSSINVDSYIVRRGQTVNIYLTSKSNNNSTSNKFPAKVYLHVYLNNNIGEPDRNLNITNTLAADGKVHMNEVKNLLPTYYKAKNSNGIKYDGLYATNGNEWVKDYVDDNKAEFLDEIDVRQGYEYVHINVMITNATAKSSNADTTNPKTGDAIFMTITVMGLSAAALTGLYFYDKKRKAL